MFDCWCSHAINTTWISNQTIILEHSVHKKAAEIKLFLRYIEKNLISLTNNTLSSPVIFEFVVRGSEFDPTLLTSLAIILGKHLKAFIKKNLLLFLGISEIHPFLLTHSLTHWLKH